jgi:hypothetical protein
MATATNHATIERGADAKPTQKPQLENTQALGRCRAGIELHEKLV